MSLESGGLLCVGALDSNLSSVAVKMFSYVIDFKNKIYIFLTFNAIWEDNATIYSIAVNTK
jgi:hypothetical protein